MSPKKIEPNADRLLTDVELELMTEIWRLGRATVKEVATALAEKRQLAYTTVATVMKILEQKNFLRCQKDSYAHVFYPEVSKAEYEATCLDHMVEHVFDGEPIALVQRLILAKKLSKAESQVIEKALQDLAKKGSKS